MAVLGSGAGALGRWVRLRTCPATAVGVPTPAIDALMSGALARLGRDLTDGAPTLAALGLGGLDVTGLIGFARSGLFP